MKDDHPIHVLISYKELESHGMMPNELHIWMLERFGLTGDLYSYHPSYNHFTYSFKDEKDAVFFTLRWGGLIRTVEMVENLF